jgi:hypothetical protein
MALRYRAWGHRKEQIFAYRHMGKQQVILEQHANAPLGTGQGEHRLTAQQYIALKLEALVQGAAYGCQQAGLA